MMIDRNDIYINDLHTSIGTIVGLEKIKDRTILLTGCTGTVGSYLADVIIEANKRFGLNVTLVLAGRDIAKMEHLFDSWNDHHVQYVYYDMTQDINFSVDVDYVIHAAGCGYPRAFSTDPVGILVDNVLSTKKMLDYAKKHNAKRFLCVSSGEVYGNFDQVLDGYEEDRLGMIDILSARSCYPMSKRAIENLCASYMKQYGLEMVTVRLCHTFGPMINEYDNRAHAQFFRDVDAHKDVILKSSGEQMRSYNYVGDAISAILTVLIAGIAGEAYNIANPDNVISIAGLATTIAKHGKVKVVYAEPSAVDLTQRSPIIRQVLNTQKIQTLGWSPAFSLKLGVDHTLSTMKCHS